MAQEHNNEALQQVFDSFDKDNSGFLDTAEVVQAAKELGVEFTEDDVQKVFQQVDKNFDGKITFAEFAAWWKLGKDNKMEKMVFMKMKALNLLKKARQAHTRYGTLLESKYGDQNEKNIHVGFQVGEPEEVSTGNMRLRFNTDDVETMFEEFSAGLDDFSAENPTFTLRIRSENPDDAVGELEEKMEEVKMMLQQIPQVAMFLENLEFSYGVDGDFVKMGVICNIPQVLGMMGMVLQQIEQVCGNDSVTFDMDGAGDYSPGTILGGTVGDINPQFKFNLDGSVKGTVGVAFLHQIINNCAERKMNKDNYRIRHMEQLFVGTVASLFSGAKMQVRMNKVDHKSIIGNSPMAGQMEQMQDAPVSAMLEQFVPMATQMLSQAPPMVRGFLDLFYNNFESEGGFMVHAPHFGFQYSVKTEGFAKAYDIFFPSD